MRWFLIVLLAVQAWAKPIHHEALYGKISLDITPVKVGKKAAPAWCYRTHGLKPEEVSLTLLRRANEQAKDYPVEPIQLLRSFARAGKAEFGVADFGGKGFLRPEFKGFLLVPGQDDKAVLPVFQSEMEVADGTGPSRVTGQLANQIRYYPFPFWCDRDRRPVFTEKDVATMKTDQMLGGEHYFSQATAMLSGSSLNLRLPPKTGARLAEKLLSAQTKGTVLRMALQVDPRADCFLIWTGNPKREAVSVEGSQGKRISLQWICFVGEQSKNQAAPIEDGVGVLLTSKDYSRLAEAAKKGNLTLPLSGTEPGKLVVEQAGSDYQDPITGATYRSTGSWYKVEADHKSPKDVVDIREVVLLTSDAEIGARVGVKPLAAYILTLQGICRKRLISLRGPRRVEVAIDCRLRPGKKATITCAVKNADPAKAPGFRPALEAVRAPAVTGEVHFQLLVDVKAKR
jgi:hypothetical protein